MTTKQLMVCCQEYYGMKYTDGQAKMVARYLETFSERTKDYLLAEVLKVHSGTYKSIPDIAIFEKSLPAALDSRDYSQPSPLLLESADEMMASPEMMAEFEVEVARFRSSLASRSVGVKS